MNLSFTKNNGNKKSFIDLFRKPFWIMLNWNGKGHYITNLQSFIALYKFYVKFDFHGFVQKSYEFHVIDKSTIFLHIQYLKYLNG
jgi:hypothetical protein